MIQMIINYFSKENKEKRQMLRILNNKIAETNDYEELLKLIKIYNKLKNENKTN
jgi:hypothetical protein